MGYLTVYVAWNDSMHKLRENGKETTEALFSPRGFEKTKVEHIGEGQIKVFEARHADDDTLYFLHGNTMMELSGSNRENINAEQYDEWLSRAQKTLDGAKARWERQKLKKPGQK